MTDNSTFLPDSPDDNPLEQEHRFSLGIGSMVLIAGVIAVAAVFGIALARQSMEQPGEGRVAPDFTVTTFDGETFALSDLRGQVVVVNFWASWCGPCIAEAPELQATWERFEDQGVVVLGIAYADTDRDSLAFIAEHGITYPNAPDLGTRISDDYAIQGVPETFIIDQKGEVAQFIYAQVTEDMLAETITRLLNEDAS